MKEPLKSKELFTRAKGLIPGGVNSPVRAFKSVGMDPLFIQKAYGSRVFDVDQNEFIDYVCSWGPLILGHAHPRIIDAVCKTASAGTSFGAPCENEIELAQLICDAIPSVEMVRMVNSGTEATMSAIRLARAYTNRDKIVKFEGCYHGHADSFLIKAGSGMLTGNVPTSPGVPEQLSNNTLVAVYNDIDSVKALFSSSGEEIAAVIVEPVAGNMGLVLPDEQFLRELREITSEYGSLLIFDEVITGFRLCYGGYQNLVDIKPDLTTLGKIIGGGLPVGAYGGKADIMSRIAPQGDVYQAGTLSGNPVAMAAGAETLKYLKENQIHRYINELGNMFGRLVLDAIHSRGLNYQVNQIGSMLSLFFTGERVKDYSSVMTCDTRKYARFFRGLLQRGVYFPPAQFEVCFVSAAHTTKDIEITANIIAEVLESIEQED